MELLSALVGAIVGAFISAFLASLYMRQEQKKQLQIQTTMNLYDEFQNENMLESRIKADKALDNNRKSERPLSFIQLHQELEESTWHHVSRVIHFWEKFSVLYELDYLNKNLARTIMGRYFSYYYIRYLKALGRDSLEKDEESQSGWINPINRISQQIEFTTNNSHNE